MWYGIVNYGHHAVHYIPRSYNWKLVPFDQPQNTLRSPANMRILTVDEDVEVWGLPYTVLGV